MNTITIDTTLESMLVKLASSASDARASLIDYVRTALDLGNPKVTISAETAEEIKALTHKGVFIRILNGAKKGQATVQVCIDTKKTHWVLESGTPILVTVARPAAPDAGATLENALARLNAGKVPTKAQCALLKEHFTGLKSRAESPTPHSGRKKPVRA